jgi:hypothetical protein
VTIPENVDAIHSIILGDRRIYVKKIAETLAISRDRDIREILNVRNLSAK